MSNTYERLNEIISIRGIKQVELIEKTGISKGALSSYLSGRYIPKQDNIYKLARALDVNPAWLMGLDVPMILPEPAAPSSDPVAPIQLRSDESELLSKYNRLNDDGKREVKNHTDYILSQNKFLKDTSEVIREVG